MTLHDSAFPVLIRDETIRYECGCISVEQLSATVRGLTRHVESAGTAFIQRREPEATKDVAVRKITIEKVA